MAADPKKIGVLLERLAQGVAAHDRENPSHHSWGIGMAKFDIDHIGLEEGEEILPGIILQADGGSTGTFRVLCDGDHGAGVEEEEEEVVDAVAEQDDEYADERELERETVTPGPGAPPPLRPPF
jgi:hypothetical protein